VPALLDQARDAPGIECVVRREDGESGLHGGRV
jgi:hypothetical protein